MYKPTCLKTLYIQDFLLSIKVEKFDICTYFQLYSVIFRYLTLVSIILLASVLLVDEVGVPIVNHRPATTQ